MTRPDPAGAAGARDRTATEPAGPAPLGPAPLRRLVEAMPKAELHLHLDGSLLVATALEIAVSRGIDAPRDWAGMFDRLVGPAHGASQDELLDRFDLPVALMQDAEALSRIAADLVATKAAENVRYAEIRWAPTLHLAKGLPLRDGIAAVVRGGNEAAARAGIEVRWICTALRSHSPELAVAAAEASASFRDEGLVGFDLAGREERHPDPAPFLRAYEAARAGGLRATIHAGEWGGAAQVRRALAVSPERIAHGPGAIDDPGLCRELIERGVTLDLCPTSNVQAAIVPSVAAHPLARLRRAGVPVTLSTDDLTVSDTTLSEEYARAVTEIGLTLPELWATNLHALDVAFADAPVRARLRAEFEAWGAGIAELA
jgi:adenosine deaminase